LSFLSAQRTWWTPAGWLPEASLGVFNMLGQKVATLASGSQPAGVHQVRWALKNDNGALVQNGVYFVRLESGSQKSTRKLIVVR
jgi:flagellar hook assembly protein FlgD